MDLLDKRTNPIEKGEIVAVHTECRRDAINVFDIPNQGELLALDEAA